MYWKAKLGARCANAEEQLLAYADEPKNNNSFLNTKLLQNIKAWNDDQKVNSSTFSKTAFNHCRRRQSVIQKPNSSISSSESVVQTTRATKQELKSKLRHYQNQTQQQIGTGEVEEIQKSIDRVDNHQKADYILGFQAKGFERVKKLRSFSISFRKNRTTKSDKTAELQYKKGVLPLDRPKQKAQKQLNFTFYPLTTHFSTDAEQQRLAQKIRFYLKKRSILVTL